MSRADIAEAIEAMIEAARSAPGTPAQRRGEEASVELATDFLANIGRIADALESIAGPKA